MPTFDPNYIIICNVGKGSIVSDSFVPHREGLWGPASQHVDDAAISKLTQHTATTVAEASKEVFIVKISTSCCIGDFIVNV